MEQKFDKLSAKHFMRIYEREGTQYTCSVACDVRGPLIREVEGPMPPLSFFTCPSCRALDVAMHRAGSNKDCDECLETGGHEVGPL